MKTKRNLTVEEQQERNAKWIMAVFFIVFFALAYVTRAQVQRTTDVLPEGKFVCKTPDYPLMFQKLNDQDTLFLAIIADSIGHGNVYSIMLYSYWSGKMPAPDKGIKVYYRDGTFDEFEPIQIDKANKFVRYNIIGTSFEKMRDKEAIAITFKEVLYCESCMPKRYFMDFLAMYDK